MDTDVKVHFGSRPAGLASESKPTQAFNISILLGFSILA